MVLVSALQYLQKDFQKIILVNCAYTGEAGKRFN